MSDSGRFDVVGVGRSVYDFCVLVHKYPECDEKTEAISRFRGGGSPVPNALCQLSKWGVSTLLCSNLGSDHEAELFLEDTNRYGVNTKNVRKLEGFTTPRAYIWVEKDSGKRTVVLDRDIASLSEDDLPYDELKRCRYVLLDGWEAEAAISAAEITRSGKGKVVLDAGNIRPRMEEQLKLADYIVVPLAFSKAYFGKMDLFTAVRRLKDYGATWAIITNGAGGCVAAWEDQVKWFPAYPNKAVDSTGAGDVFHAGILHGLTQDWQIDRTIMWAAGAASLAITALGGRGKLPDSSEVNAFLCMAEPSWKE